MRYPSFHRAYLSILDRVHSTPEFANAPRGFASRECLYLHFTLANPVERICYLSSRKTNIVFNFAEALWHLSGDNSLDFISYYGRRLARFTMDGKTLAGTAYGPRIFSFGKDHINQWDKVVELLSSRDPDSKRATIQIFSAEEWLVKDNIDVACTIALQFFVRDGRLYAASFMRANDAYRGMVSDVFSFTLMQELMARQLGLEVGYYHHCAASLHTYESDNDNIRKVLEEFRRQSEADALPFFFPCMPVADNWANIKTLLQYEESLRKGLIDLQVLDVDCSGLQSYWQQVLLLFGLYRRVVTGNEWIDSPLFNRLWPIYQYLFSIRWAAGRHSS